MGTLKIKDIVSSLIKKGFKEVNTHHEMFWYHCEGKKTSIRTRVSHSDSEIGDNLIAQMARQVNLSKSQFNDLIEFPLTEEQYKQLLIDKKIIVLEQKKQEDKPIQGINGKSKNKKR